jgi:Protein of unknown function DUF262
MNTIITQENLLLDDMDSNIIPPSDVVVFNELRSCADLMRLYTENQLNITPDFQRNVVWTNSQQTRFIDSLGKQLPIPNICIAHDLSTKKRIVIDGLQRITSIIKFLDLTKNWKLTSLPDVDASLSGKSNNEIKETSPDVYSEIQNLSIPVTMIRCDLTKKNHNEYIFTIFHRLNTGGSKLNNQEIRNGVYGGDFNNLLKFLAKSAGTIAFFGKNLRFRNEEAILRFFSFHYFLDDYDGKLTGFLNDKMLINKDINQTEVNSFTEKYNKSIAILENFQLEEILTIKSFSRTVKEGILHGISKNLVYLQRCDQEKLTELFIAFTTLHEFTTENLQDGLAAKDKLIARLKAAENCFSK